MSVSRPQSAAARRAQPELSLPSHATSKASNRPPSAAASRPTTASRSRPQSATHGKTAASRPSSAVASRPWSAVSRASTAADAPAARIASRVRDLKDLMLRRPQALNPSLERTPDEAAALARERGLSPRSGGLRGDHLVLHRRQWGPQELSCRVEGFDPRVHRGASATRSRVTATVARAAIRAFSEQHRTDDVGEDDDEEDIEAARLEAEARRKAEVLAGGKPTKPGGATGKQGRPASRTLRRVHVTLVQSESVVLKYLAMLDRVCILSKDVPAESFRLLHAALERAPVETVSRAGHESFKAFRKQLLLDRAVGNLPLGGAAALFDAGSPSVTPATNTAAASPTTASGLTPVASTMASAANPALSPVSQNRPGRVTTTVVGAGLSKAVAQKMFTALEVFGEGWVASRPTLAALRFVCGDRSALNVVAFAFQSLAAHGSMVTPTDIHALHRFAHSSSHTMRTEALALASLGTYDAARSLTALRGVPDHVVLAELVAAKRLFSTDRESVLWAEFMDLLEAPPTSHLAQLALVSVPTHQQQQQHGAK